MTNGSSDRLDRIEALLQQSVIASDERMTRIEQRLEQSMVASDERMNRIEQRLEEAAIASDERMTRIEQIVESNNKFLESFSADLRRYTDSMNNLATRIDGLIATNNQDRQESNSRLAVIQRQVAAIAKHLGVM